MRAWRRSTAAGALTFLLAALSDDGVAVPRGLQPLQPLAPILQSALVAAENDPAMAAGVADAHTADYAGIAQPGLAVAAAGGGAGGEGLAPPRRLPAVVALFLAEAVTQLAAPEAGMHRRLGKLLSARPDLDLDVRFRYIRFGTPSSKIMHLQLSKLLLTRPDLDLDER